MAATVRGDYYGASATEPAGVTAETGIKWNREDSETGTTPIPIPNATGTNYSWYKLLALDVTATAATNITNRRVSLASTATTGLFLYFQDQVTYTQPSSGNKPTDSGSNGATPAGYTLMSTSLQVWDNTSHSTGSSGRNGDFCQIAFGVDNTYTGGAGSAISLPNLTLTYDEA